MHTELKKWIVTAAIMSSTALAGCVQMPTEKQSAVDQRPQISFRFEDSSVRSARVLVDDLDVGRVSDFQDGRATLRVLPGTHVIKVQRGDESLLNERAYLADGAVRPFTIK
jgi:hypothetical protein